MNIPRLTVILILFYSFLAIPVVLYADDSAPNQSSSSKPIIPNGWDVFSIPSYGIQFAYDPGTSLTGPCQQYLCLGTRSSNGNVHIDIYRLDMKESVGNSEIDVNYNNGDVGA